MWNPIDGARTVRPRVAGVRKRRRFFPNRRLMPCLFGATASERDPLHTLEHYFQGVSVCLR